MYHPAPHAQRRLESAQKPRESVVRLCRWLTQLSYRAGSGGGYSRNSLSRNSCFRNLGTTCKKRKSRLFFVSPGNRQTSGTSRLNRREIILIMRCPKGCLQLPIPQDHHKFTSNLRSHLAD